jgi:hypothetical protein
MESPMPKDPTLPGIIWSKHLKKRKEPSLKPPSKGNARKKALMFVEKRIKKGVFCLIDQWVKLT